MTKEDVKNFLHENRDNIVTFAVLTATGIGTYAMLMYMYGIGYARGVENVSNNVWKLLGYEKYEQLRVSLNRMVESK